MRYNIVKVKELTKKQKKGRTVCWTEGKRKKTLGWHNQEPQSYRRS